MNNCTCMWAGNPVFRPLCPIHEAISCTSCAEKNAELTRLRLIAARVDDMEGMAKVAFTDDEWERLPSGIKEAYLKGARVINAWLTGKEEEG